MKLGCKIGEGNTAEVYEWGADRVIKLFYPGFPASAIEKEYVNAKSVKKLDFDKVHEHGIVSYGNRTGIVYDQLEGESLLDYLHHTGNIDKAVTMMTGLHNAILDQEMFEENILYYKKFLNENNTTLSEKEQEFYHEKVSRLPDDSQLCHGDFHPGNIILTAKGPFVIDFMNICRGPELYDVARTYFLMNSQFPVSSDGQDDQTEQLRRRLVDGYLASMRVMPEEIEDYLEVIRVARKGEELS